jgi:hypothetical protein
MPYSVNGCGTTFYGRRDKEPDGSYVATEWIVLIHIPILPLRSLRVLPVGSEGFLLSRSEKYLTKDVPLNIPQVISTYLIVWLPIAIMAGFIAVPAIMEHMDYVAREKARTDAIADQNARLSAELKDASQCLEREHYEACLDVLHTTLTAVYATKDEELRAKWKSLRDRVIQAAMDRYVTVSDVSAEGVRADVLPSAKLLSKRDPFGSVQALLGGEFTIRLTNTSTASIVAVRVKGSIVLESGKPPKRPNGRKRQTEAEIDQVLNVYLPPHSRADATLLTAFFLGVDLLASSTHFDSFQSHLIVQSAQAIESDRERAAKFLKVWDKFKAVGEQELPPAYAVAAMACEQLLKESAAH